MSLTQTFFFYDYETFGLDPKKDRIAQFAGIRTDRDFNIIGEPINLYCKQYDDYIPNPESILITGITPDECNEKGVSEAQFSKKIHAEFAQPNSCILGYNNIRFDDEMTRYLFYRNFYDPYAYSWQNGNSRWDLVDVVRATYALRPNGIEWPMNEENLPHLTLENLTSANGLLHDKAHDALSDVYGTIELAKLLRQNQPKLFEYYFQNRSKRAVESLLSLNDPQPIVHISGMFGAHQNFVSLVTPIATHPLNPNAIICADLSGDIDNLIQYDATTLESLLYTRSDQLPDGKTRTPLKLIHINRAPILAPMGVLKDARPTTFDLNDSLEKHQQLMLHIDAIKKKSVTIFDQPYQVEGIEDVEAELYDGFFSREDRQQMDQLLALAPEELANHTLTFDDRRIEPLLFRYRAKNYPETLNNIERDIWTKYSNTKRENLQAQYLPLYQSLLEEHVDSPELLALLQSCASLYQ